jgi:hypothetical protein
LGGFPHHTSMGNVCWGQILGGLLFGVITSVIVFMVIGSGGGGGSNGDENGLFAICTARDPEMGVPNDGTTQYVCLNSVNNMPYCYGSNTTCLWNNTDCNTNADCNKYTLDSAKYTDGVACGLLSENSFPADHWAYVACGYTQDSPS